MSMEYIIFDGIDSRNYGVYVHGDHAYDRPARRAERVTVQGRHGLLTTSEDCFEESVVTYPMAIVSGFKTNLDAWINALASRRGRHRLTDSFNADEYRMASFLDAVEADPIGSSGAGRFEVTFQCLPQRFLIEGEKQLTYPPGIANSKNLLPYPYYQTTRTVNGVTFTDNGDGTITVDGTATATCNFFCHQDSVQHAPFLDTGEYIMSGCPQGGSNTGYSMYIYIDGQYKYDYGSGLAISVDADDKEVSVVIHIANGATVNNKVFRPMIRNAYENLLTLQSGTTTVNGLVFTANSDGSVNVNGTATANTNFVLIPNISSSTFAVHGEEYVISTGMDEAGGADKWFINGILYDSNKANGSYMHSLLGADAIYQPEYTVDTSVKGDSGYFGGFYLRIANGYTCEDLTFRPMIRLASETDPDWVPYYDGATQIYNPTLFDALPLIRVYGAGTVGIGGMEVTVASSSYEYIDIDCDIMDCFNGTDNCNSLVSFSDLDFPVLKPGVNVVSLGENISRIEVKPRWWRT